MTDEKKPQAERLHDIFMDCLFQEEELTDDGSVPEGAVLVDGIQSGFGFNPLQLEEHHDDIVALIDEIVPDSFLLSGGGGQSFLNLCENRDGELWTGMHPVVEQLVVISMAIGHARYCAPRKIWGKLPGGMPYIQFGEVQDA